MKQFILYQIENNKYNKAHKNNKNHKKTLIFFNY